MNLKTFLTNTLHRNCDHQLAHLNSNDKNIILDDFAGTGFSSMSPDKNKRCIISRKILFKGIVDMVLFKVVSGIASLVIQSLGVLKKD